MRARPSPSAVAALAALAAFTVWITWRAKAIETRLSGHAGQATALDGKPAPDFRLAALDGRTLSPADFRGKKLVVSFWASWCGPCRMELPALAKFYRQTHKSDADYEIVSINIDDDRAAAQAAATELKVPFPVLLDPTSKTSRTYGVDAIPTLFVIDKDGKVLHGQVGFAPGFEIILAQQLGIRNFNPITGAADASGSH
ncbi:MAG: TlpA family protein disulfide reductase [Bryobacteraceae bacterium]